MFTNEKYACCSMLSCHVCDHLDTNTIINKNNDNTDVQDHFKDISKSITRTKINAIYSIMSLLTKTMKFTLTFH